jgi:hypothetical protein
MIVGLSYKASQSPSLYYQGRKITLPWWRGILLLIEPSLFYAGAGWVISPVQYKKLIRNK